MRNRLCNLLVYTTVFIVQVHLVEGAGFVKEGSKKALNSFVQWYVAPIILQILNMIHVLFLDHNTYYIILEIYDDLITCLLIIVVTFTFIHIILQNSFACLLDHMLLSTTLQK